MRLAALIALAVFQMQAKPTPWVWQGERDPVALRSGLVATWFDFGWEPSEGVPPTSWPDTSAGEYAVDSLGSYPLTPSGSPTLIGSPLCPSQVLNPQQGGAFNGTNQYAYRADESGLRIDHTHGVTFAAWVYMTGGGSIRPILYKGDLSGVEFWLYYNATVQRFVWGVNRAGGVTTISAEAVSASGVPALNTWYLLVGWYDPAKVALGAPATIGLHVNGGPVGASTFGAAYSYANGELRVGRGTSIDPGTNYVTYWAGRIYQVARWNRVLNLRERQALFGTSLHSQVAYEGGAILVGGGGTSPTWQGNTPDNWQGPDDVPGAPSDLTLSVDGSDVTLEWTVNSYNQTEWEIEVNEDGAGWAPLDTAAAAVNTYTHATTSNPAQFGYRVRAVNAAGESAWAYAWTDIVLEADDFNFYRVKATADEEGAIHLEIDQTPTTAGLNSADRVTFDVGGSPYDFTLTYDGPSGVVTWEIETGSGAGVASVNLPDDSGNHYALSLADDGEGQVTATVAQSPV